jgi:hypothetical protein
MMTQRASTWCARFVPPVLNQTIVGSAVVIAFPLSLSPSLPLSLSHSLLLLPLHISLTLCMDVVVWFSRERFVCRDMSQIPDGLRTLRARAVITCGGLHADALAVLSGGRRDPLIMPVRGEYLVLKQHRRHLVRGNIYPVGSADVPFLGVHFTPRSDGTLWLGPNAVPAFGREGYSYRDVNAKQMWDLLTFLGTWSVLWKHKAFGLSELSRSLQISEQVKELQVRGSFRSLSWLAVCRGFCPSVLLSACPRVSMLSAEVCSRNHRR